MSEQEPNYNLDPVLDAPPTGEEIYIKETVRNTEKLVYKLVDLRASGLEPVDIRFYEDEYGQHNIVFPFKLLEGGNVLQEQPFERSGGPTLLISIGADREYKTLAYYFEHEDGECSALTMLLNRDNVPLASIIEGEEHMDADGYHELVISTLSFIDGYIQGCRYNLE